MAAHFHKAPLTNIEKLKEANMSNKIIINPPDCYNHLLFERYAQDKFSITAFNPFGHKAFMVVKNIALIPLSFLTYRLLMPKRPLRPMPDTPSHVTECHPERFKPKKGIL